MLKRRSAAAGFSAVILFAAAVAWTVPVAAEPAGSHGDSLPAPVLRTGDLVRLRSGGPLMTVDKVEDDQVLCYYSTEYGEVRSGSFRIAELTAPITSPPPDPDQKKDEAATDR